MTTDKKCKLIPKVPYCTHTRKVHISYEVPYSPYHVLPFHFPYPAMNLAH